MRRGLVSAALLLVACGDDPHVYLTITARTTMHEAATVRVKVIDSAAQSQAEDFLLPRDHQFPSTLTIATGGRSGNLTVEVAAFAADETTRVGAGRGVVALTGSDDLEVMLEPDDFIVNAVVANSQELTEHSGRQLALGADGSFMVVWGSSAAAVYGRIFNADTTPRSNAVMATDLDFALSTYPSFEDHPVVAHGEGGYLAVWESERETAPFYRHLRAQVFASDDAQPGPYPDHAVVSSADASDCRATTMALGTGYAIAWLRGVEDCEVEAHGDSVWLARLDAGGNPVGSPTPIASGDLGAPDLAQLGADSFVLLWEEYNAAGYPSVVGRIYDDQLAPLSGELDLSQRSALDAVSGPHIVATTTGFAMASSVATEDYQTFIELRLFDAVGAQVTTEVTVGSVMDWYARCDLASADGIIVVTWADGRDGDDDARVWYRGFDASGAALGPALRASERDEGLQTGPTVVSLGAGGFLIAWTDTSGASPDAEAAAVRARVVYPVASGGDGRRR